MKTTITRSSKIVSTARLKQLEGMFDVQPSAMETLTWEVNLDLPSEWNIGVIVGASGSGKSTIAEWLAKELGTRLIGGRDKQGKILDPWEWPADRCIVDGFPAPRGRPAAGREGHHRAAVERGILQPAGVAATVPRPEQRAAIPRQPGPHHRGVGQDRHHGRIQLGGGSHGRADRIRRRGEVGPTARRQIHRGHLPRGCRRVVGAGLGVRGANGQACPGAAPPIELEICRVETKAWEIFKPHHYLTAKLHPTAACFGAFYRGELIGFDAWLPFVGRLRDGRKARRGHRTVVLPDYQGVGIGAALFNHNASLWRGSAIACFRVRHTPQKFARV